jgi:hypothetical protein
MSFNMGGGGQQQMMMSSASAVSFSVLAAGLGFAAWQMNWFGGGSTPPPPPPVIPTGLPAEGAVPVTQDLSGARLILNGYFSMRVVGSSCSRQQVRFSQADGEKWTWSLNSVGTANIDGQTGVPVYTIESIYKRQGMACDERFLTAPIGCNDPPYLDVYRPMNDSQRWILVQTADGRYEIRSLLCAQNNERNQFIKHSGSGNNNPAYFTAGTGTRFQIPLA